ncbi:hypothetical protein Tco_0558775 [Tanacetum coccineum]
MVTCWKKCGSTKERLFNLLYWSYKVLRLGKKKRSKCENQGKVLTEMELVLEQTQQGTSYEDSVSAEGVEELKRKVKIKDEKKEALLTLRQIESPPYTLGDRKRFDTSAGNPVKEILLKLNLPDHRILKDGHGVARLDLKGRDLIGISETGSGKTLVHVAAPPPLGHGDSPELEALAQTTPKGPQIRDLQRVMVKQRKRRSPTTKVLRKPEITSHKHSIYRIPFPNAKARQISKRATIKQNQVRGGLYSNDERDMLSSIAKQTPIQGLFQIPIAPEDQEKTTFTYPYVTFAYRRMPFGLCNAPATFQRCMTAIFHDMVEDFMEVFMDDFSAKLNDEEPWYADYVNHIVGKVVPPKWTPKRRKQFFSQPYLDAQDGNGIYNFEERNQHFPQIPVPAEVNFGNPNELCKSEEFTIVQYSIGIDEEFITLNPGNYNIWGKTHGSISSIYHDLFNKKFCGWFMKRIK